MKVGAGTRPGLLGIVVRSGVLGVSLVICPAGRSAALPSSPLMPVGNSVGSTASQPVASIESAPATH